MVPLWITRKNVCFLLFLITEIIFNYGPSSGESLAPQQHAVISAENQTTSEPPHHAFLNGYIHSVFNKTRTLEEVIYSDLLNNLRNLISIESDRNEPKGKHLDSGVATGRGERKGKQSNRTTPSKISVSSSGGENFAREKNVRQQSGNVTRVQNSEYLLGYSGNPFGSRRPIAGLVQLSESDTSKMAVGDPRRKRSVLHLYNMVLCTTGCNPFAYKGYGCYCGFLGSGFVVDGIDSCCKMHDWCYNSAGCPMFLEYFIPYLWKCYHHQPLCAIDHGQYGGPSSCAQRLCECDRQLALCLRRYPCPSTKALCTSSPWRLLQNVLML